MVICIGIYPIWQKVQAFRRLGKSSSPSGAQVWCDEIWSESFCKWLFRFADPLVF